MLCIQHQNGIVTLQRQRPKILQNRIRFDPATNVSILYLEHFYQKKTVFNLNRKPFILVFFCILIKLLNQMIHIFFDFLFFFSLHVIFRLSDVNCILNIIQKKSIHKIISADGAVKDILHFQNCQIAFHIMSRILNLSYEISIQAFID